MNRVPVIVRNPEYIEEVELDGDGVVPVNIIPYISGDSPIVTVPASEDENVAEDNDEDENMDDILEKLEKRDAETKELQRRLWIFCPPSRRT